MDLPVGLASDVDVMEVAAVIFGVSSSQQQLTTGIGIWVPETHRRKTCCSSSQPSEDEDVLSAVQKMQHNCIFCVPQSTEEVANSYFTWRNINFREQKQLSSDTHSLCHKN